jgi:hypothetical protein
MTSLMSGQKQGLAKLPTSSSPSSAAAAAAAAAEKAAAEKAAAGRGVRYEGQFFKTKLCMFYEKGMCTRGKDCKYAHGDKELHDIPDLTNTSLCRRLAIEGRCDQEDCLFAHSLEELRATNKFFKTSMCSFHRFGRCRMGNECRHAHHESELQVIPQPAIRNAVAPRTDTSTRTGRRGARNRNANRLLLRQANRFGDNDGVQEDDDDDIDDLDLNWERTMTTPANPAMWTFNEPFRPSLPRQVSGGPMDGASRSPMSTIHQKSSIPWADADDFDEDDELNLNNEDNMWARMQTMPVSFNNATSFIPFNVSQNNGFSNHLQQKQKDNMVEPMGMKTLKLLNDLGTESGGLSNSWQCQRTVAVPMDNMSQNKGYGGGDMVQPVMMVPCMLVPMPMQQLKQGNLGITEQQMRLPSNLCTMGTNVVPAVAPSTAGPVPPVTLEATKAIYGQLEAKLLESVMPECYED